MARFFGDDDDNRLNGTRVADLIYGRSGDDRIQGFSGNDTLNGGEGNDLMTGGAGADRFVFLGGWDRITDFENGDDEIDLSAFARISGFGTICDAASQHGTDVVITLGASLLVIDDVRLSQLSADDITW